MELFSAFLGTQSAEMIHRNVSSTLSMWRIFKHNREETVFIFPDEARRETSTLFWARHGASRKCWDISKWCGSESSEPVRNATNICSSHHARTRTHPQKRKCGDLRGWIHDLLLMFFSLSIQHCKYLRESQWSYKTHTCFIQQTGFKAVLVRVGNSYLNLREKRVSVVPSGTETLNRII